MGSFIGALKSADTLSVVATQFDESDLEQREAFASYLEEVAKVLTEIHTALLRRKSLQFALGKLQALAWRLPQLFPAVPAATVQQWARELVHRWPQGDLPALVQDEQLRQEFEFLYEQAADKFDALAERFRSNHHDLETATASLSTITNP